MFFFHVIHQFPKGVSKVKRKLVKNILQVLTFLSYVLQFCTELARYQETYFTLTFQSHLLFLLTLLLFLLH